MIFTNSIVAAVAVFMPLTALAAPADHAEIQEAVNLFARNMANSRELSARQGNTCAFGGNRLCTTRVRFVLLISTCLLMLTCNGSVSLVATAVVIAMHKSKSSLRIIV